MTGTWMAWAEEDADVDGLVVLAEDVDGLVAWQRKALGRGRDDHHGSSRAN